LSRQEHRSAEEAIQGHSLQVQQFERDHERLQQAVEKLEGELAAARQAQDALDDQKQENVRAYSYTSRTKRSQFLPPCDSCY
jgi:phage shock protein A